MKNKFLVAIFVSAFLLITPTVKAVNFTDNQTVDTNKTWTVKFTGDVGFDDATKQGITVTDSKGSTVNVGIQLGQDSKTVKITAPQEGYTPGESYILNVGTKAHSNNGKALKNGYTVHFNIKSSNEIVTFKDKNLEQVIRQNINKPTGDIYKSDVEKITFLNAINYSINDISGIENLTNLNVLFLNDNQISDIRALKELTNLNVLYLHSNQINDISPLKELSNLKVLDLYNNQINDISPLKGLTNLQELSLNRNQISDINILKGLTNLQMLNLTANQISDADIKSLKNALPNCFIYYVSVVNPTSVSLNKTIDTLTVEGTDTLIATVTQGNATAINQAIAWTSSNTNVVTVNNGLITGVSAGIAIITATTADGNNTATCTVTVNNSTANNIVVFKDKNLEQIIRQNINKPTGDIYKSDVEKITFLNAINHSIKDISGIENLTNLRGLVLNDNQISDISALEGLTTLNSIELVNNQISDVSALKGLINLKSIELNGNEIKDISALKGLTNLQVLNLYNNQISKVDIQSLKDALPKCNIIEPFYN